MSEIAMEAATAKAGASENASQKAKTTFARRLASPDKKTREKAISLLTVWLTSQDAVNEHDLKKIWKGLFYCVWHADKVQVQVDLIERLAAILEKLDVELAFQFFSVFLSTMRREWPGIDRLRLDKFYLLLRKFLVHMFMVLEIRGWDSKWTKKLVNTLEERTFLVKDQYAAQGINFHYADIFLTELQKFASLKWETVIILFEGFCNMLAKVSDKLLLSRMKESFFVHLLERGKAVIKSIQEGGDVDVRKENIGLLVLTEPLTSVIFQLAFLPSIAQPNRKVLYELHSEFLKLEKAFALSGITISASVSGEEKKEHGENNSGDQSQDLGGNSEAATASRMLENMKHSVKRKRNSQKAKLEDKSTPYSKKSQKVSKAGSINAIFEDADENLPPSKEMLLDVNNLDVPETGSMNAIIQVTDENLPPSQEKILEERDPVIANLKKRFDSIATTGLGDVDALDSPMVASLLKKIGTKKRKRQKAVSFSLSDSSIDQENGLLPSSLLLAGSDSMDSTFHKKKKARLSQKNIVSPSSPLLPVPGSVNSSQNKKKASFIQENGISPCSPLLIGSDSVNNTSEKKKKVRFALKNNLVWMPFSPLPPQILRVPPSATPRGSALKKGVPPGPIIVVKEVASNPKKGYIRRPSSAQRTPKRLKNFASSRKSAKRHSLSPR